MKNTITNKFFATFLVCVVSLASCGDKKEDDPNPDADNTPSCKITTVVNTEIDEPNDRNVTEVEYNNLGYVTKVTNKYYENNVLDNDDIEITTFAYNSNNQLIKQTDEDGDYTTYEYNSNGTISKSTYFYNGTSESFETYTYDANKRLTQATENYLGSTYKRTYEYMGNSENISKISYFNPNNQLSYVYTYENYDDKLNPFYALKGIVLLGESRNNSRKITEVYKSNNPGQPDETDITTYTYKYNSSGFVTEKVEIYNGAEDDKEVYTYTGCN